MLADLLVHTFTDGAEFFAGAFNGSLVNGESNIHRHSICAHVICVNMGTGKNYFA